MLRHISTYLESLFESLEWVKEIRAAARQEISRVNEYDYVIINENLDEALRGLTCIVQAERLRMATQLVRHHDLVTRLG